MRDSTYVVIALALCSLVMLAMSMQKPKAMYMLDLEDFKALPVELRSALRRMLPDPVAVRQKWAHMTPDQKRTAIQHLGGFMKRPQQDTNDVEPEPELVDEPESEAEPAPVVEPEIEPVPVVEPEPAPRLDTVKKGKKKDTKNKKENEVIALGAVGTDVSLNGSGPSGGFLGRDD